MKFAIQLLSLCAVLNLFVACKNTEPSVLSGSPKISETNTISQSLLPEESILGTCGKNTLTDYNGVFGLCREMSTQQEGKECKLAAESFLIARSGINCTASLSNDESVQLTEKQLKKVIEGLQAKGI